MPDSCASQPSRQLSCMDAWPEAADERRLLRREKAQKVGAAMCAAMKDQLSRQMFEVVIQAAANGKIIARETMKVHCLTRPFHLPAQPSSVQWRIQHDTPIGSVVYFMGPSAPRQHDCQYLQAAVLLAGVQEECAR